MANKFPLCQVDDQRVVDGLNALRQELQVPREFSMQALKQADEAATRRLVAAKERVDRTDIEFVTVDPETSTDLDQALHVAAVAGQGKTKFRVYYAIADLAFFIEIGSPLEVELQARGMTHYSPDGRSPLHPDVLGTKAASLLPDGPRPALLWTVDLDSSGEVVTCRLERAIVRSRAKLSYQQAQQQIDQGTPVSALSALKAVGELRLQLESERGGISLTQPPQEVVDGQDGYLLAFTASLQVERWNAQLSLLCGMQAGEAMVKARVGLLRTMPPIDQKAISRLRLSALALGCAWPDGQSYGAFVRSLDPATAVGAALLNQCAHTLRGSGYTAFNGVLPEVTEHAAIASSYAHVTAPIRRLVDRYANEVAYSLFNGLDVPEDVLGRLDSVADSMAVAARRTSALERGSLDLVEALLLNSQVGKTFQATVIDGDERGSVIQIVDPAVQARIKSKDLELAQEVTVRLIEADPLKRTVKFETV